MHNDFSYLVLTPDPRFLTGAIKSRDDFDPKDARLTMFPRFSEENFAGNLRLVEGVEILAKEKGCTPGQLALAWVLAQGEGVMPLIVSFDTC